MSRHQTNHRKKFQRLLHVPYAIAHIFQRGFHGANRHDFTVNNQRVSPSNIHSLKRTQTDPTLFSSNSQNAESAAETNHTWTALCSQETRDAINSVSLFPERENQPSSLDYHNYFKVYDMGNVHQGHSMKTNDSDRGTEKGASVNSVPVADCSPSNTLNGSSNFFVSTPPLRPTGAPFTYRPLIGHASPLSHNKVPAMEPMAADIVELKATIQEKDRRIDELASEVDKLNSVLQQHISECDIWKKNPPAIADRLFKSNSSSLLASSSNISLVRNAPLDTAGNRESVLGSAEVPQTPRYSPPSSGGDTLQITKPIQNKRLGVSAEPTMMSTGPPVEIKYYDKNAKSRQEIRNALRNNEYLKHLDAVQLQEIVSCMYPHNIVEGCYIIREGEDGHHLYVAEDGEYEVWKGGKYLYTMGHGNCFGELALLYNTKRTASIKAVRAARIWVLERSVFQFIMMKTGLEKMEERVQFLSSVPLLKTLESTQLHRIADVLEAQFHSAGECIIRQGELADSFFIIQSGQVRVTMKVSGADDTHNEVEIRRMTKGEYFGEKALLGEGRRTANIYAISSGVELLCLYRKDFLELMGNIEDLEHKEYVDIEHFSTNKGQLKPSPTLNSSQDDPTTTVTQLIPQGPTSLDRLLLDQKEKESVVISGTKFLYKREYSISNDLRLSDLERVAVIGQGGFGRVELVRPTSDLTISFALKRMKKVHIVETKQQDHVHSEKRIMMTVDSPFICKLFKTFKDNKFVYMLMEFCPGGELWTILRDKRAFDDKMTRFSLSCVIEAFDYLHQKSIVYRDLKPENMLLTTTGYIKLCDFGFAKRLGSQRKTWTFCGTPEYVAPEVILNKGHDFAADYWSLGILTCELLMGTPPFQASEPIKIYMKALRGIEAYDLSHQKNISAKAYQFIKKLCRINPTERLGMGRLGIQEVRNQKYFQGFDWEGVRSRSFPSPFRPKVAGPLDFSNFDQFPAADDSPPDEMSGWDKDF